MPAINPRSRVSLRGHPVITRFLVLGDQARGRAVGLAVDNQGTLLIADDTGNCVWCISAASP
jgi:glucose/arabinose dehydrogenase